MTPNSMPGAGVEPALPCGKGILRTTQQRSGTEREGAPQSERAPGQGARGSVTERTPAPDPAPCSDAAWDALGARAAWAEAMLDGGTSPLAVLWWMAP